MLRDFLADLRYSLRAFVRTPLFAVTAVCSLGLGIGACTVIYSVIYPLLLKPLPYAHPAALVNVLMDNPSLGDNAVAGIAPATVAELAARTDLGFSALGGQMYDYANLTGVPNPTQLAVGLVTHDYLPVFGVRPALGRLFNAEDFRAGAPLTVVVSDKLWRAQFRADPGLPGQTIRVGDKPRIVVGIMPATFREPNGVSSLWLPIQADDPAFLSQTNRSMIPVARLADDRPATLEKARAGVGIVAARLAADHPAEYKGWRMVVRALDGMVAIDHSQQRALWLLLGAVGCVLLVTCANVANLQLVRANARQRELGVRLALGASRGRIIRQCLAESVLLGAAGGGLGLLLTAWGVDAVRALLPPGFATRQDEIALDLPVLGFSLAVAGLAGVLSGVLPAWFAARQDPAGSLAAGGGRGAAGGAGSHRTRNILVVAEISMALVLLAGAGLMGRSFLSLLRADPGLRTERVLTLGLTLSNVRYPDAPARAAFYQRILDATRAVPGVGNVALATTQFFNWTMDYTFTKSGQSPQDAGLAPQHADYDAVNPAFFAALDIPIRRGRAFDERDHDGAPFALIVNETFARKFLPDANPLGQKIMLTGLKEPVVTEIVGVAADVRRHGVDVPPVPQIYACCLQRPTTFATLYMRAAGGLPAEGLLRLTQAAIWKLDPDLPVSDVSTLAQARRDAAGSAQLYLVLFGLFAALTIGLAALGIYGTVSYSVAERTRELGIRLALGAPHASVLRLVLGQGVRLAGAGLGLGLVAALALARLLSSLLYGVTANDPVTLFVVAFLLGSVALLASYLPARRATRIDPLTALREE